MIYKKQHNRCSNLIKKDKASYHRYLIDENATNPKNNSDCIKAVFPLSRVTYKPVLI